MKVPFNKPYMTGKELEYIRQAHDNGHLSDSGPFTKKCQAWLERCIGCYKALLVPSCTCCVRNGSYFSRYKASKLRAKAENTGFEVIAWTSFMLFLLPAMMVSRLLANCKSRENYDVRQELKINSFANEILKKILGFEQKLIRLGISLPFSSSILMVLRRK